MSEISKFVLVLKYFFIFGFLFTAIGAILGFIPDEHLQGIADGLNNLATAISNLPLILGVIVLCLVIRILWQHSGGWNGRS